MRLVQWERSPNICSSDFPALFSPIALIVSSILAFLLTVLHLVPPPHKPRLSTHAGAQFWPTLFSALPSPNDSTALHFRNISFYLVLQICIQPPSPSSVSLPPCGFSDIQSLLEATYSNGMCQGNITVVCASTSTVAASQLRACSLQMKPKPHTWISETCSSLIRNNAVQYKLSSC